jgi:CheY-like chemotaxis protein
MAGAETKVAANGAEGLSRALAERFDALLMDIGMPVMDGFEATAALRRRGYRTPIVALTAHALPDDVTRCLQHGFDAHLSKPLDRRRMIGTLSELIRASRQASALART